MQGIVSKLGCGNFRGQDLPDIEATFSVVRNIIFYHSNQL
jgi:hypothetical protein